MKKIKIIYWTTTVIIFLLEGLMPALTSNTELARQGISHLGYPDYFRVMLTVFKVTGSLVLVLPFFKSRYKEWAYAGFAIDFICAGISHWVVDGFGGDTIFPFVALIVLATSNIFYHKMISKKESVEYSYHGAKSKPYEVRGKEAALSK